MPRAFEDVRAEEALLAVALHLLQLGEIVLAPVVIHRGISFARLAASKA
jgi:hypothetical protein